MNWQGFETFSQRKLTSESFDRQWQQFYHEKLLCRLQWFFPSKANEGKMEATSRQTQCPVSKILQSCITELNLTVLLVLTEYYTLFRHDAFVFTFSESLCYVLLFSWPNKNVLFWQLWNVSRIARPALVSRPPNRKEPYNKHLISLVFSVCTVNYGSRFFSIDLWKKTWPVIYSTDRKLG